MCILARYPALYKKARKFLFLSLSQLHRQTHKWHQLLSITPRIQYVLWMLQGAQARPWSSVSSKEATLFTLRFNIMVSSTLSQPSYSQIIVIPYLLFLLLINFVSYIGRFLQYCSDELQFNGLASDNKKLKIFNSDPYDYQSIIDALKGCSGLFYTFEPPKDQPSYDVSSFSSSIYLFQPTHKE